MLRMFETRTTIDHEQRQQPVVDDREGQVARQHPLGVPGVGEDDIQGRPDQEDAAAERHETSTDLPDRRRKPNSVDWASTMNDSWASRNSTNSSARGPGAAPANLDPPNAAGRATPGPAASPGAEELADVVLEVVPVASWWRSVPRVTSIFR